MERPVRRPVVQSRRLVAAADLSRDLPVDVRCLYLSFIVLLMFPGRVAASEGGTAALPNLVKPAKLPHFNPLAMEDPEPWSRSSRVDMKELLDSCRTYFLPPWGSGPGPAWTETVVLSTETLALYHSNKIENAGSSLQETTKLINQFLQDPVQATEYDSQSPTHAAQQREVVQHFQVLRAVRSDASNKLPLTEEQVMTWHCQLMTGLLPEPEVGRYRQEGVMAGELLFPEAEAVPGLMCGLLNEWQRKSESPLSPFAKAAWLMHSFVAVHPFIDGNGRLSRLLGNYALWHCGFPLALPITGRSAYMKALRYADRGYDGTRRTGLLAGLLVQEAVHLIRQHQAAEV